MNKIIQGDCLLSLKTLGDNSIDSIVTDPPYELGFMGKSWDNTGIANNVQMWKECLRVLKPGGHLLSFGGTRTYHRMASAIEDAGFEVRDMIEWVYGSGFPKSLNISKAIEATEKYGKSGTRTLRQIEQDGNGESYELKGKNNGILGETRIYDRKRYTPQGIAKQWEGWGTALKPAHEPICMARKPLSEKTVAENCLKWGTGGINIEQSRVLTPDDEARKQKILAGEVVCNAFCDKHGLYPSSLDDILSFSQQQLLDFYQHIFSELGSYSISYTNLLHNLDGLDYKSCKRLLGVPYDCGRLSERVNEYVYGRQQYQGSQSDCPTLSRLYGECVRWNLDVAPNVFPLNDDVQSDILHYLSSKENNLLDNNPHLVFVLVCLAYSLLVNNNLHNHYTTCKNKMQVGRFPSNLLHDNSEEVRECFPSSSSSSSYRPPDKGGTGNSLTFEHKEGGIRGFDDSGNASRFFRAIPQEELKNCSVVINCAVCGKPKKIRASLKRERNYCSLECSHKGKTLFNSQNVVCDFCGKEFLKKNSQMFTEKNFCSRECLGEWQSKFLIGENSYNWKDGKMDLISRVRSLKKMIDWRNEVYKRDDYTCQKCGDNTGGNLEAHHKNHLSDLIRELNIIDITDAIESKDLWDIDNGITLCNDCHTETHKTESKKSVLYFAKASKAERNRGCDGLEEKDKAGKDFRPNHAVKAELGEDGNPFGRWGKIQNNHPTVKPIALMEYLIKMVTPKGGTVLDPFMGSGSTGVAAKKNGYDFIGIELEEEYMKIAEARLSAVDKQTKLL